MGHQQVESRMSEKVHMLQRVLYIKSSGGGTDLVLPLLLMYSTRCSIWTFSDILDSTWWWPIQQGAETCSWFFQKFIKYSFVTTAIYVLIFYQYRITQRGWCYPRVACLTALTVTQAITGSNTNWPVLQFNHRMSRHNILNSQKVVLSRNCYILTTPKCQTA
jgi:hypothetical protein